MRAHMIGLVLALTASAAQAATLSGTGGAGSDPALAGASVVGFEGTAPGSYASLSFGDLAVSGIGGAIRVDGSYAGNYNGRGSVYLDNAAGATQGILFTFGSAVSAFAFNFGASNVQWTLTAFDVLGNTIESVPAPITGGSNAGDYIGISAAGIASATLTASSGGDWVFVDDIAYAGGVAAVPLPAGLPLLLAGLGGLGLARRRRD